jgi:hypothetical protein
MRPIGHESRGFSLKNLGSNFVTRFRKRGEIDDITRAVSLYCEALASCPPGHPGYDTTLNNRSRSKLDMTNCMSMKISTRSLSGIVNAFGWCEMIIQSGIELFTI